MDTCSKDHLVFTAWVWVSEINYNEATLFSQEGLLKAMIDSNGDFELTSYDISQAAITALTTTWSTRASWVHVLVREELSGGQTDVYFDGSQVISTNQGQDLSATPSSAAATFCANDCMYIKHFHKLCGDVSDDIEKLSLSYMRTKFMITYPDGSLNEQYY
jgi:hypothetical protein